MQTIHVSIIITTNHPDPVKKLAILLLICTIQVGCEIKCSVGRKQTIHLKDAQNIQRIHGDSNLVKCTVKSCLYMWVHFVMYAIPGMCSYILHFLVTKFKCPVTWVLWV